MRTSLNVIGAILMLVGAVWALQGLNVIGGSFMTGQTRWLVIGVVCAICGALILALANVRRR